MIDHSTHHSIEQSIVWVGSPNRRTGRRGYRPRAIVVHIMQGSLRVVDRFFSDPDPAPDPPVSAHYGIGRSGLIHQYVAESDTAWHCGRVSKPRWHSISRGVNPNLYTIGIEHEGISGQRWTAAMYDSSAWLIVQIANRWSIPIDRDTVIGHSEIYDQKPFCPGPGVDLDLLVHLAHSMLLSGAHANFVDMPGETVTRSNLHLRIGAPTSQAASAIILPRGTRVLFVGWTSNGESVNGNAHWYRTADGDYFWAGATSEPTPAVGSPLLLTAR